MPLTKAQIAEAKKAIGGLNLNQEKPYVARDSYEVASNPSYLDGNADTAYRDMFYEQFTQPGMFASPTARATAPNEQGTNAILQGIQDTMQTLRSQQFIPSATTETKTRAQDVYYNPLDQFQDMYTDLGGRDPTIKYHQSTRDKMGLTQDALLKQNIENLADPKIYSLSKLRDADLQAGADAEYQGFRLGDDASQFVAGQNIFEDVITSPGQYRDYEVQYNAPDPNAAPTLETRDLGFSANENAAQEYMDKLLATNLSTGTTLGTKEQVDPRAFLALGEGLNERYAENPEFGAYLEGNANARNDFLRDEYGVSGYGLGNTSNNKYYAENINHSILEPSFVSTFTGQPTYDAPKYYTPEGVERTPTRGAMRDLGYTIGNLDATSRAFTDLNSALRSGDLNSQYLSYGDVPGASELPQATSASPQSYKTLGNALAGQRLLGILGSGAAKGLI